MSDYQQDDKIGQILLKQKIVDTETLAHALKQQEVIHRKGGRKFKVGEILLFMKKISLQQLQAALLNQRNKAQLYRNYATKAKQNVEDRRETAEIYRQSIIQFKGGNSKNVDQGIFAKLKQALGGK